MGSTILLLRHITTLGKAYGEVSLTVGHLEKITIVIVIFTMLLVAFGGNSAGATNSSNSIISSIFAPFPAFCGPGGGVLASCSVKPGDIVGATAFIATAILYPAILGFSAINRVIGFGSAIQGLLLGPTGALTTIPFVGFFFLGMILLSVYELFRMARGNASGGTM